MTTSERGKGRITAQGVEVSGDLDIRIEHSPPGDAWGKWRAYVSLPLGGELDPGLEYRLELNDGRVGTCVVHKQHPGEKSIRVSLQGRSDWS